MITKTTIDLDKIRSERERIELHIGRLSVAAAAIDQKITTVLAIALRSEERGLVERVFNNETASLKLKFLDRALRDSWPHVAQLLASVRKVDEYRNQLSHSTLVTHIAIAEGVVTHHSVREKTLLVPEHIELSELEMWETRASVVHAVVDALSHHSAEDFAHIRLHDLACDFFSEPDDDVQAAIAYLYPL